MAIVLTITLSACVVTLASRLALRRLKRSVGREVDSHRPDQMLDFLQRSGAGSPLWKLSLVTWLFASLGIAPVFAQSSDCSELAPTVIQPGSRYDVTAIGNRRVGRGGLGNWYSLEKEVRLGGRYAAEIDATTKFILDREITAYFNRVGQRIAQSSDAVVPFNIRVIDSPEVNIFGLPGGFLYISLGTIGAVDDESELAAVMAHEIAHVAARHATRQKTRTHIIDIGMLPLLPLGGLGVAARAGLPLVMLRFSREFEREADLLAVQYVYAAGYDPLAYVRLLEKIQALGQQRGAGNSVFSPYPRISCRVQETQHNVSLLLPSREEYLDNTSEFDEVKNRLLKSQLTLRRQTGSGPRLRRRTAEHEQ